MKPRHLYLTSCVAGTVFPYSRLIPFLREHGLDFQRFFEQLFSNRLERSTGTGAGSEV